MSGIKSDRWIRRQCLPDQGQILQGGFKSMIEPYEREQVRESRHPQHYGETTHIDGAGVRSSKIISYGTSSYGYDVCETSYKDRAGKYQGQTGVTLPRT